MSLAYAGAIPISVLNIGLSFGPPMLSIKIAELVKFVGKLTASIAGQIKLKAFGLPSIAALGLGIQAQFSGLPNIYNPANWVTAGVTVNTSLLADFGLIQASLKIVGEIGAMFELGLAAPGISAWTYTGACGGFGKAMSSRQWGKIKPTDPLSAVVILVEDQKTWKTLGKSVDLRGTQEADSLAPNARYLGLLSGGQINIGVLNLKAQLDLLLFELKGAALALQMQIQASLGINLPGLGPLKAALSANADLKVLLGNLAITIDLAAQIELLQLQIGGIRASLGELNLQLSTGGLGFWTYSGEAEGFWPSINATFKGGNPQGRHEPSSMAYALALAGSGPGWNNFGVIFKTG